MNIQANVLHRPLAWVGLGIDWVRMKGAAGLVRSSGSYGSTANFVDDLAGDGENEVARHYGYAQDFVERRRW